MKKSVAILIGISICGTAFAKSPMLQLHCYEQVHGISLDTHTKKYFDLYKGAMPLGTLRLPSKADAHNKKEYFISFSANGKVGGKLEMIQPEPPAQQDPGPSEQNQCKEPKQGQHECPMPPAELIPGDCVEISPPAPMPQHPQCPSQDQGQEQNPCVAQQDAGQCQQQDQMQDQGQAQEPAQEQTQTPCPCQPIETQPSCDLSRVRLYSDQLVKPTVIDFKHEHSAALALGQNASLKIDHHRGIAGLRVTTTCDVEYLGEK